MNNMKFVINIILIVLVALFIIAAMAKHGHAEDGTSYRIYTEAGGMNVTEANISEGHKSYHTLGIETIMQNNRVQLKLGLDGFLRGEPKDEDPEIPCAGAGASIEYAFKAKPWIFPYLGIRYDHLSRGTAPKYDDPNDPEYASYGPNAQIESEHDIVSARGGIHLMYKWLYCDLGTIIPFYTSTKSGNFAPDLGIGFKVGNWDLGYRFRQLRMTDNHFSGDTALSFYFSGVQLGYTF